MHSTHIPALPLQASKCIPMHCTHSAKGAHTLTKLTHTHTQIHTHTHTHTQTHTQTQTHTHTNTHANTHTHTHTHKAHELCPVLPRLSSVPRAEVRAKAAKAWLSEEGQQTQGLHLCPSNGFKVAWGGTKKAGGGLLMHHTSLRAASTCFKHTLVCTRGKEVYNTSADFMQISNYQDRISSGLQQSQ